jgi:hypothetical protein
MGDTRTDKEVSPYLQRPLRSYEQAIRESASRRKPALLRVPLPQRPSNSNEPQDKKSR